jgi:hypothetical protein
LESAIVAYARALRIVNRYPPAKADLDLIAKSLFGEAIAVRDTGNAAGAIALLVRSRELNPDSGEVRGELERLLRLEPPRTDLTRRCFIFPDATRAEAWYREAIRTCLEFVAYGGIDGEVLEFGVLAGWTARIFAETLRDLHYLCDLYLFDSFGGLPRQKHPNDAASPDVNRGVWRDEMDVSVLEGSIGEPVDEHIRHWLSTVISADRIKLRRGFFSDTLDAPLDCKAALVHLDCDLYSSTLEVLQALDTRSVLQDGTVLMFDDWNCNRASPQFGQRRAFAEFLKSRVGTWEASPFLNYGYNSAAFILHDMRAIAT